MAGTCQQCGAEAWSSNSTICRTCYWAVRDDSKVNWLRARLARMAIQRSWTPTTRAERECNPHRGQPATRFFLGER